MSSAIDRVLDAATAAMVNPVLEQRLALGKDVIDAAHQEAAALKTERSDILRERADLVDRLALKTQEAKASAEKLAAYEAGEIVRGVRFKRDSTGRYLDPYCPTCDLVMYPVVDGGLLCKCGFRTPFSQRDARGIAARLNGEPEKPAPPSDHVDARPRRRPWVAR